MSSGVHLDPWVRALLRCPVTGTALVERDAPDGGVELVCTDPTRTFAYPVRDGIPILLVDEAREVHSGMW
jgi:uncharacterized protein